MGMIRKEKRIRSSRHIYGLKTQKKYVKIVVCKYFNLDSAYWYTAKFGTLVIGIAKDALMLPSPCYENGPLN